MLNFFMQISVSPDILYRSWWRGIKARKTLAGTVTLNEVALQPGCVGLEGREEEVEEVFHYQSDTGSQKSVMYRELYLQLFYWKFLATLF